VALGQEPELAQVVAEVVVAAEALEAVAARVLQRRAQRLVHRRPVELLPVGQRAEPQLTEPLLQAEVVAVVVEQQVVEQVAAAAPAAPAAGPRQLPQRPKTFSAPNRMSSMWQT
jgi:hypothetical protein